MPAYQVPPGSYPNTGYPGTGVPVVPIGNPIPGTIPIVYRVPLPQPVPQPAPQPSPQPVPQPNPQPQPQPPPGDVTTQWAPWPMPPRQPVAGARRGSSHVAGQRGGRCPLNLTMAPGSHCEHAHRDHAGLPGSAAGNRQLVEGAQPTPGQDLHYQGGRTWRNMSYVNLYVSGEEAWQLDDVQQIDRAIADAMLDEHLNNVILQYFNNQPIGTQPLPSHPLVGYVPRTVSRGDIELYVKYLYSQGYLQSFDLSTTVFNFLLPSRTLLTIDDAPTNTAAVDNPFHPISHADDGRVIIPESEEGDSHTGLGGYHGSIHVGGATVYFSVEVYSEQQANGVTNGIPVLAEPWKNIVATLYHEMQEVRTDPDVEEVIRNPYSPGASHLLGWTSNSGEEIGDFPLHDGVSIRSIIVEVPLADGSGMVPVQLQYSNAVHGPEGPIPQPHPQPAH